VAAALLMITAPAVARADDASEFELGKNAYDRGDYEGARARFSTMLDPKAPVCNSASNGSCRLSDPEFIERARALQAASLIALGKKPLAEEHILRIYLDNPGYAPSPAVFPPEVIDTFTEVEGKNRDKIREAQRKRDEEARKKRLIEKEMRDKEVARIALLEHLAGQERVVETNSRMLALLPLGAGQFQNGDVGWGIGFASTQVLAGGLSIISSVIVDDLSTVNPYGSDPDTGRAIDTADYVAQRDAWVAVNQIAFGAWALATVVGIVHAQITFVPEKTTIRPRPIPKPAKPPPPTASPTVGYVPGGATLGIVGSF
jgi:hypothetical protein